MLHVSRRKNFYWVEFNLLLETVDLNDKICHLFVVNTEFDYKNADTRHLMYNEIYPPVIEKQKKLDANERSIFQLCESNSETSEHDPKLYRTTKKYRQHYHLKNLSHFT